MAIQLVTCRMSCSKSAGNQGSFGAHSDTRLLEAHTWLIPLSWSRLFPQSCIHNHHQIPFWNKEQIWKEWLNFLKELCRFFSDVIECFRDSWTSHLFLKLWMAVFSVSPNLLAYENKWSYLSAWESSRNSSRSSNTSSQLSKALSPSLQKKTLVFNGSWLN